MPLQSKLDRQQLQFLALEDLVENDSVVRVIDLFCNCLDYDKLGFVVKGKSHEGKPAYEASTLTGIYIYGYLNKIRSCRLLAKACKLNVELWWLTGKQTPGYKTIADFRKDNSQAFKNLFNAFTKFCLELDLYGRTTIAIDGSKFRAQNSKKNNYNLKKINQHLDYIAKQKEDYIASLDRNDQQDAKLEKLENRRLKYENLKDKLNESGESQISTTDPEARALPLHMSIVEVAYNVQSAVDDKYNLIVDFDVTNKTDFNALAPMCRKARQRLELKENQSITALADKGYYSAKQITECHNNNVQTLVSPKSKGSKSKDPRVSKDKFQYNTESDSYTCPKKKKLVRQGKIYHRKDGIPFKRYVGHWTDCKKCPWVNICVSPGSQNASRGRMLNRSIYEDGMDINDAEVNARKSEYKRRQAIIEHPFGTIKRQWGYNFTLLKTIEKVKGEFSIIMLCYNFKRAMSILGLNGLKKALISSKNEILSLLAISMHHMIEITFSDHQLSCRTLGIISNKY